MTHLGDLWVSRLGMGCATFSPGYGVRPAPSNVFKLMQRAYDGGIRFFDTSLSYAYHNAVDNFCIGREIPWATKVEYPYRDRAPVSTCSLIQAHNFSRQHHEDWHRYAVSQGRRMFGATIYDDESYHAALECPLMSTVQVPFSLVDRRFSPSACQLIARSVLLQGVLTKFGRTHKNDRLRSVAEFVRESLGVTWEELPIVAIRFALSFNFRVVLVGMSCDEDVEVALEAWDRGPLDSETLEHISRLPLSQPKDIVDPRRWRWTT